MKEHVQVAHEHTMNGLRYTPIATPRTCLNAVSRWVVIVPVQSLVLSRGRSIWATAPGFLVVARPGAASHLDCPVEHGDRLTDQPRTIRGPRRSSAGRSAVTLVWWRPQSSWFGHAWVFGDIGCYGFCVVVAVDVPPLTGGKWLIGVSIPVLGGWIAAAALTNTDMFSVQFWLLVYLLVAGLAAFVWVQRPNDGSVFRAGGLTDPCPSRSGNSRSVGPRSACSCCSSVTEQPAGGGRRRTSAAHARGPSRAGRHLGKFMAAVTSADVQGLLELLAADLVLIAAAGGLVAAARKPLPGPVPSRQTTRSNPPLECLTLPAEPGHPNLTEVRDHDDGETSRYGGPMASTILLCTDGSDEALGALSAGLELLGPDHEFVLVTVSDAPDEETLAGSGHAGPELSLKEYEDQVAQAREKAQSAVGMAQSELALVQAEVHVLRGDPGAAICQLATELSAGAIVMGSRGRGGLHAPSWVQSPIT